MQNNVTIIKGVIKEFDDKIQNKSIVEAMYRIININNHYFFAEEISTGCIFPIYSFDSSISSTCDSVRFINHHSHLRTGKFFAFCPITSKIDNPFEYCIDKSCIQLHSMLSPSVDEVNTYLEDKEKNKEWKLLMKSMEKSNTYMCNLDLIKSKITIVKGSEHNQLKTNFKNKKVKNKKYVSSVKLKEISDFGYDLSCEDNLYDLIDREDEMRSLIKTAFIRNKSVLLIGPPGCGKTSIVKKIALLIKEGGNSWLEGKLIFNLNLTSLISGTRNRGEFEEKLQTFVEFCSENKDKIVVFIDEIHNLFGLGRCDDSALDAMNILKSYIDKSDIIIIGATTNDEYSRYLTGDPAFLRRFSKIEIAPPDSNLNIKILLSYIKGLEAFYKIKFASTQEQTYFIVNYILNITDKTNQRVVGDIKVENPTISKNIIEDAFAEAIYNRQEVVTINDIYCAIMNCDKLSATFKTTVVQKLKENIIREQSKFKVISL